MYYLYPTESNDADQFIIKATYDEGRVSYAEQGSAYAWYQPYGDGPHEVKHTDIRADLPSIHYNGKTIRKVHLKPGWHIENDHVPLVPLDKTFKNSALEPYNTHAAYWAIVREFCKLSERSAISNAVMVIKSSWTQEPRLSEAAVHYLKIEADNDLDGLGKACRAVRDLLTPILASDYKDSSVRDAVAGALTPKLPPPEKSSLDYPVPTSPRLTWQWRLMYVLCMGIALDKL